MAVDNSIATNASAFAALRTLSKISTDLTNTQNRVASGLRVSSALDDSAAFALAQGIRTELKAIAAVSQGLDSTKASPRWPWPVPLACPIFWMICVLT